MPQIVMLAMASPIGAERDEKFNEWYDGTHIPQLRAAIPGIRQVRRFRAAPVQPMPDRTPWHQYLAVYDIEADSPEQVLAALGAATAAGAVDPGPDLDSTGNPPVLMFYEVL